MHSNSAYLILKRFPDDVLKSFKGYTREVLHEVTAKDKMSRKVYDSFSKFQRNVSKWADVSEVACDAIREM